MYCLTSTIHSLHCSYYMRPCCETRISMHKLSSFSWFTYVNLKHFNTCITGHFISQCMVASNKINLPTSKSLDNNTCVLKKIYFSCIYHNGMNRNICLYQAIPALTMSAIAAIYSWFDLVALIRFGYFRKSWAIVASLALEIGLKILNSKLECNYHS